MNASFSRLRSDSGANRLHAIVRQSKVENRALVKRASLTLYPGFIPSSPYLDSTRAVLSMIGLIEIGQVGLFPRDLLECVYRYIPES